MMIKSQVSTSNTSKFIRILEETSAGVNDERQSCDWLQIRAATHIRNYLNLYEQVARKAGELVIGLHGTSR